MIDVIAIVGVCVVLGSFGQILIKMGLTETGGIEISELLSTKFLTTVFQKYVFIGVMLYFLSTALWFVALSKAEVSYVYPLISMGYILTAFLARFFFNENIPLVRWFGILLIIGGVFLVTRS